MWCGADIAVGGTTWSETITREAWLKPGAVFISLARREFERSTPPHGAGRRALPLLYEATKKKGMGVMLPAARSLLFY
jgi:hypothetical protein